MLAVNMKVLAKCLRVAGEVHRQQHVSFETRGEGRNNFDSAATGLIPREHIERLQARQKEHEVNFVAAGIANEPPQIDGRVVTPRSANRLLPAFRVDRRDGSYCTQRPD